MPKVGVVSFGYSTQGDSKAPPGQYNTNTPDT